VAMGEAGVRQRKVGIASDRLLQEAQGDLETVAAGPCESQPPGDVRLVRIRVFCRMVPESKTVRDRQLVEQRAGGTLGDRVLDGKDVGEVLVEPIAQSCRPLTTSSRRTETRRRSPDRRTEPSTTMSTFSSRPPPIASSSTPP
jgi:hypothetical protein